MVVYAPLECFCHIKSYFRTNYLCEPICHCHPIHDSATPGESGSLAQDERFLDSWVWAACWEMELARPQSEWCWEQGSAVPRDMKQRFARKRRRSKKRRPPSRLAPVVLFPLPSSPNYRKLTSEKCTPKKTTRHSLSFHLQRRRLVKKAAAGGGEVGGLETHPDGVWGCACSVTLGRSRCQVQRLVFCLSWSLLVCSNWVVETGSHRCWLHSQRLLLHVQALPGWHWLVTTRMKIWSSQCWLPACL